jgi:triosephosphate isomerase
MRRILIAGNWKMHKTIGEALELVEGLLSIFSSPPKCEVAVMPPFTALYPVSQTIKGSFVKMGAQNVYWEKEGAFTGEISPRMLKDIGCAYTIVGHSERRHIFGEPDGWIADKAVALQGVGVVPVICVGERLEEREAGKAKEVVASQLKGSTKGVSWGLDALPVIAYEPVWAIGTGKTATPETAQEMHSFIREWLSDAQGNDVTQRVRILYGGSVKPENAKGLLSQEDIDGALVGGASLNAQSFAGIIREGDGL